MRLLVLLLLSGCSTPVIQLTALPNGTLILEHEGIDCPTRKNTGGCFIRVAGASYFPFKDENAKGHERGHGLGGDHADWLMQGNGDKCAVITQQGKSDWLVGNLTCRRPDGSYYQTTMQQATK